MAYYNTPTYDSDATWDNWTSSTTSFTDTWGSWTSSGTDNSTYATTWKYWSTGAVTVASDSAITMSDETWAVWVDCDSGKITYVSQIGGNHKKRLKENRKLKRKNNNIARAHEKQRRKNLYKKYLQEIKDREADKKAREADKKAREADKKARELILDLLPEDQREIYEKTGRVFVKGKKFDWLISRPYEGRSVFVQRLDQHKVVDICVHFKKDLPADDKVIGYAMRAKYSEADFRKTGNEKTWTEQDRSKVENLIREAACL